MARQVQIDLYNRDNTVDLDIIEQHLAPLSNKNSLLNKLVVNNFT